MEKRGGRGWENFGNVSIKFTDPPIRLCNILITPPPPPPRQQLVGSQFSLQTLLATTDPPSIPPQNHETPPPFNILHLFPGEKVLTCPLQPNFTSDIVLGRTLAKRLSQRSCERLHFQLLDREADTKCYHLSAPTTSESSTNILRYCTVISTVGYFVL